MTRDDVLTRLRAHRRELQQAGITSLFLFGSTARGDARPDSDVDLLATFDDARRLSLLDLIRLERRLADILGRPVDLVEDGWLPATRSRNVEKERVVAF